jgi:branched-chain amino acid transport system substrate-binding protein
MMREYRIEPKRGNHMKERILAILVSLSFASLFGGMAFAQTPSAASKAPIRIGQIGPLSGPSADDELRIQRGTRLALEEVKWEVAGRKIELLPEDSPMNPAIALAKLKKLYYDDKVKIIIGPHSSASGLAVRDFIHENKILTISPMCSIAAMTQARFSPYFFRVSFNDSGQTSPFEGWLLGKLGYKNVTCFAPDFAAGHDELTGLRKGLQKSGGNILQEIYFPLGTTMDYAPYLAKIDTKKSDAVFAWVVGGDAVRFIKQYADYGYKGKVPILTGPGVQESYLEAQGDAALGIQSIYWYSPALDTAENRRFKKVFAEKLGANAAKGMTSYEEHGYVAGKVLIAAIAAVKGNIDDTDGMIKAIEKIEFEAPRGPFKFYRHNPVFYEYLRRVDKIEGGYQNTVLKCWGPLRQGWLEEGYVPEEVPIPGKK